MAKTPKTAAPVVVAEPSPDVRTGEFGEAHHDLAAWMHLDLSVSAALRVERAVHAHNQAVLHMVEAGLLLASVRAEVGAEAFAAFLDERGLAKQRAYELMGGAALIARLPADQRTRALGLSKSKVLALANASPAAVQAALEDEDLDLDLIGVRALRDRIRELEAATTDLTVQRDTAEAEAEGLRKKLKRGLPDRQDEVPHQVADARAEIVALGKKAGLALDAFTPLFDTLGGLREQEPLHDWAEATQRLAAAQLAALAVQLNGVLRAYLRELPGEDATPTKLSYLTKQEVIEAAKLCAELTQVHEYERLLREWERQQASPNKGKGRPKAKPVPPGEGAAS